MEMKNLYQLYKDLLNITDENEFIETLRHNRVPEEDIAQTYAIGRGVTE